MTEHLVAFEAVVVTLSGVKVGGELKIGEELVVVDRTGEVTTTTVTAVRGGHDSVELRQLLTHFGEVLVPESVWLTTPHGRRGASELADTAEYRIEVIPPGDLPAIRDEPTPLDGVLPFHAVIPQANGTATAVRGPIVEAAARLGITVKMTDSDRWLAVCVDEQPTTRRGWTWHDELCFVRDLCAWEIGEYGVSARVRVGQPDLQRRLIGAYIAAREQFRVDWLPTYHPVECRITPEPDPWPPYAVVQRSVPRVGQAVVVETDAPGAPIIGSTIVHSLPSL